MSFEEEVLNNGSGGEAEVLAEGEEFIDETNMETMGEEEQAVEEEQVAAAAENQVTGQEIVIALCVCCVQFCPIQAVTHWKKKNNSRPLAQFTVTTA